MTYNISAIFVNHDASLGSFLILL